MRLPPSSFTNGNSVTSIIYSCDGLSNMSFKVGQHLLQSSALEDQTVALSFIHASKTKNVLKPKTETKEHCHYSCDALHHNMIIFSVIYDTVSRSCKN